MATTLKMNSCRYSLRLLFVGKGGEGVEDDDEDAKGGVVCPQLGNGGSLQIYRAQNLYIVSWRQYEREALRPHRHRINRRKQSTHQHKGHNKEEHNKHCLLHRLREIGDGQAEARNRKDKDPLQILALFFRIPKKNRIFTPDCLY